MTMQRNYPDYDRIAKITDELRELSVRQDTTMYWDEKSYQRERHLYEELRKLLVGEPLVAEGKGCQEPYCGRNRDSVLDHHTEHTVYYPGKVHHLDGNSNNESFGNLAMVCPKCQAHILLSRFGPEDVRRLKLTGLSDAEIGRLLHITRERVRQLLKKSQLIRVQDLDNDLARVDEIVKWAQQREKSWKYTYTRDDAGERTERPRKGQRLTDRRTLKKRILAELNRLKANDGHEVHHSKQS